MPKSSPASTREEKLAKKLRENLRRRKAQTSLRKDMPVKSTPARSENKDLPARD